MFKPSPTQAAEYGNLLRSARRRENWTLQMVASRSGFSKQYHSFVENGCLRTSGPVIIPSMKFFESVEKIYGISVDAQMKILSPTNFDTQWETVVQSFSSRMSELGFEEVAAAILDLLKGLNYSR